MMNFSMRQYELSKYVKFIPIWYYALSLIVLILYFFGYINILGIIFLGIAYLHCLINAIDTAVVERYKTQTYPQYPNSKIVDSAGQQVELPCVRYHYRYVIDKDKITHKDKITRQADTLQINEKRYNYYYNDNNYMHQPMHQPIGATNAIIVVHGFQDSPESMNSLLQALKGKYPNYAIFLLSSPYNTGQLDERNLDTDLAKANIKSDFNAIAKIYPKPIIIAHSLGGGLIIDLASEVAEGASEGALVGADKIILLAPCLGDIRMQWGWPEYLGIGALYIWRSFLSKYCDIDKFIEDYTGSTERIQHFKSRLDDLSLSRMSRFIDQGITTKYCASVFSKIVVKPTPANNKVDNPNQPNNTLNNLNNNVNNPNQTNNTLNNLIQLNNILNNINQPNNVVQVNNTDPISKLKNVYFVQFMLDMVVPSKPIMDMSKRIIDKLQRLNVYHTLNINHCGFLYNEADMQSLIQSIDIIISLKE